MMADLTDGVIFLRPLHLGDAVDHLAGEDEAMAKWLSGGRSTLSTVQGYITSCQEHWRTNGPRRAFGVFDCSSNRRSDALMLDARIDNQLTQVCIRVRMLGTSKVVARRSARPSRNSPSQSRGRAVASSR